MNNIYIPLSVPNLKGNELKYVTEAIETEWISTGGKFVTEFEDKIAEYVKCSGAVSCQNGTSGLHISLIVCNVTKDDEVIVPALTFIAAVNPIKYVGAEPVFIDCDDSLTIDVNKLSKFCEEECDFVNGKLINKFSKKHIKAIIVVHVFGNMANMPEVMKIAKKYNIKVIEDATEALGTFYLSGKYKGKFAGTIGDIGVYSFNGNKIISTGGGGMIVSNNNDLLKRSKHLTTQAKTDEVFFKHDEIGFNYRMTNIQAAIGLAQLEQLEKFINIKQENFELYKNKISKINGLRILEFNESIRPNYWFYSLFIYENFKLNRNQLIEHFSKNNIQTRPIWDLICNQEPYLKNQKFKIENAEHYLASVINLPCSSNLVASDVEIITSILGNIE